MFHCHIFHNLFIHHSSTLIQYYSKIELDLFYYTHANSNYILMLNRKQYRYTVKGMFPVIILKYKRKKKILCKCPLMQPLDVHLFTALFRAGTVLSIGLVNLVNSVLMDSCGYTCGLLSGIWKNVETTLK